MKIAYFDCFSGVSGDMVLGALVDLGVPVSFLCDQLATLHLDGFALESVREMRGAIAGTRVIVKQELQSHHRCLEDIRGIISSSALGGAVKEKSLAVFERLAEAESRVHKVPVSQVHFHELGAVDSIVDIVGSVIAIEYLGIEHICCSPLPLGRGFVRTQHGLLPIPAPATVLLLTGIPVYDNGVERELITPTGAAIISSLAGSFGPIPPMVLMGTGYGVGSHPSADPPNLLRIMTGKEAPSPKTRRLLVMETNIDDMNGEIYDYVIEELFQAGALDVSLIPVQMKKNRPGVMLRVLLEPALRRMIQDILFRETTTLGVRIHEVERVEIPRATESIETPYGPCRIKRA
ncbi:MAG: nickel pincer cofactor biosynthesis protein LarC, partial [Deltaproteobacteria bacterium]|nr:nickel pincer cofactor biosynthesis protein LarC [Deltaproteobacteria bacterium]